MAKRSAKDNERLRMNMKSLDGKKLLVISSDSNDISFVQAAKDMGVYVVCCDRYQDWSLSPAKQLADEAWNIDYTDTEAVAEKCRASGIDGVIAGYGEDRVAAACRIARAIGSPFYATEEQINITRNKQQFKELCLKNGVPVPINYCLKLPISEQERRAIAYPVIVKPSDNGGRKGISVCLEEAELDAALVYAQEQSKNGQVVVEEYIVGTEMSSVYTLSNGEISLSCVNDKYNSEDQGGVSRLCDLVLTPSRYYDLYMQTVDAGLRKLLKDIGALNGVANFQMMVGKDGIRVFEMGFRVNGNDDFKVIRKNNGIDFLKMLISHSLTGDMGDDISKDNPCFKRYNCTLCMYLHSGTVGTISYNALSGKQEIDDVCILRQPGTVIIEDGTNRQKALLVKFSGETLEEIEKTIHFIQDNTKILDSAGNSMTLKPFRTERLFGK